MANEQNLRPFTSEQSREEAKKNGAKGGRASGESRRRQRTLREGLEILLSKPIKKGKVTDINKLKAIGKDTVSEANLTAEDAIILAMINKAAKGDVHAYEAIRDQLGEKPADKQEITVNGAMDLNTADIDTILAEVKRMKEAKQ